MSCRCVETDCAAIKLRLDAARLLLDQMMAPGVRSVRDSDGSSIEYTRGDLEGMRRRVFALEQQYNICIGCPTGSFAYIF